jgi:hypothetical protein
MREAIYKREEKYIHTYTAAFTESSSTECDCIFSYCAIVPYIV